MRIKVLGGCKFRKESSVDSRERRGLGQKEIRFWEVV